MLALATVAAVLTNPYSVFAAAQQYWRSAIYPAHVEYGIAVSVSRNGVASQAHYHAAYDASENRVTLNAVSDEELAHPYTPHGMKLSIFGLTPSAPEHTFDYLGVPILAPDYSFGIVPNGPMNTAQNDMALVQEIRREFHDPTPPRKPRPEGGMKTIAIETVAHRQYVITLDGTQPLNGNVDYHLVLKPVAEPNVYRLREMWINAATYATDRIITDGDFTAAELGGVRWQIDYRQIGNAPFIASETALQGFTLEGRHYDTATVAFSEISSTSTGAAFSTLPRFKTDPLTAPPVLTEPAKPRI